MLFLISPAKQMQRDDGFSLGLQEPRFLAEAEELAEKAKDVFDTDITYSLENKPIKTVAVVAGSGTDCMYDAMDEGADVFFTGEDRHHAFINAAENGLPLVCAGHFETEIIERKKRNFPR